MTSLTTMAMFYWANPPDLDSIENLKTRVEELGPETKEELINVIITV
jgi:hypothetical protein